MKLLGWALYMDYEMEFTPKMKRILETMKKVVP